MLWDLFVPSVNYYNYICSFMLCTTSLGHMVWWQMFILRFLYITCVNKHVKIYRLRRYRFKLIWVTSNVFQVGLSRTWFCCGKCLPILLPCMSKGSVDSCDHAPAPETDNWLRLRCRCDSVGTQSAWVSQSLDISSEEKCIYSRVHKNKKNWKKGRESV